MLLTAIAVGGPSPTGADESRGVWLTDDGAGVHLRPTIHALSLDPQARQTTADAAVAGHRSFAAAGATCCSLLLAVLGGSFPPRRAAALHEADNANRPQSNRVRPRHCSSDETRPRWSACLGSPFRSAGSDSRGGSGPAGRHRRAMRCRPPAWPLVTPRSHRPLRERKSPATSIPSSARRPRARRVAAARGRRAEACTPEGREGGWRCVPTLVERTTRLLGGPVNGPPDVVGDGRPGPSIARPSLPLLVTYR